MASPKMAPKPSDTLKNGKKGKCRFFPGNCSKDNIMASPIHLLILPLQLRSSWVSNICWWITGCPQEARKIFPKPRSEKKSLRKCSTFWRMVCCSSQVNERHLPQKSVKPPGILAGRAVPWVVCQAPTYLKPVELDPPVHNIGKKAKISAQKTW